MTLKCPCKSLNFRPPYSVFPSFCLNVYYIQAKTILFNNAINTSITTSPYSLSSIGSASSIAHFDKHINYKPLEKSRWGSLYSLKQFSFKIGTKFLICGIESFFRCCIA